ncbi:MAG TPA: hypothetical protein VM940_04650 [Chthoniobacterales bacterium]|nr:hypothetical protein [Chthoniobacterales bacterium]
MSTGDHLDGEGFRRTRYAFQMMLVPFAAAALISRLLFAVAVVLPFRLLSRAAFRRRYACPNCHQHTLDATRLVEDSRRFHFATCDDCTHQFERDDDGSWLHIPPGDPRYVPQREATNLT